MKISGEDLARAQAALGDQRVGVTVGPPKPDIEPVATQW
jgi:hypothetical protein